MIAALLLLALPASATSDKTSVFLDVQKCSSSLGKEIAYLTRESIAQSSLMQLADSYREGFIRLHVVCLDGDLDKPSVSYAFAITARHKDGPDYFLTFGITGCPEEGAKSCAVSLVAATDEQISLINAARK